MWYVVDEFGFEMNEYFQTKKEAEESRIIWENTAVAKQWNLKYEIKFREDYSSLNLNPKTRNFIFKFRC